MGAGTSTLTHEQLFKDTTQTRDVMNILLEYMIKELTVRDFVSLSNPNECKNYVLFMANNMYQHFYELKVTPLRDKKGVLAFRKVKELVDPQDDAERQNKQSLCLVLSYFYTRIFQIYGALALTLIDDANFMVSSGAMTMLSDTGKSLIPRGYRPYYLQGGADPKPNFGNFIFMSNYLSNTPEREGYRVRYPSTNYSIFFTTTVDSNSDLQSGKFLIGTGSSKPSTLELTAKRESFGSQNIKIRLGKVTYYKKLGKNSWEPKIEDIPSSVAREKEMVFIPYQYDSANPLLSKYQTRGGEALDDYFNQLFNRLIPHIQSLSDGTRINYGDDDSKSKTSEEGTVKELRLGKIIANLRDNRPLGHCVARALQLLQHIPLGKDFVSHVCNVKFYESQTKQQTSTGKTVVVRTGLPRDGSTLDDSAGMSSSELLFYDAILIGSPKVAEGPKLVIGDRSVEGRPSSLHQYITFMRKMATLFGDGGLDDAALQKGLSGIKNKRDKELCGEIKNEIRIPRDVADKVRLVVSDMFKMQYNHAKECSKIIGMLFNIKKESAGRTRIQLSDRIIKEGFPEIERINYAARELLMKYYGKCEERYLQGMALVLQSKRQGNAQVQPQGQPQQQQPQQQQQLQPQPQPQQAQQQQAQQQPQIQQTLQKFMRSRSELIVHFATVLFNYLTKSRIPALEKTYAIIPEKAYNMIAYLGFFDGYNRIMNDQLISIGYTQSEINIWNKEKQMMVNYVTRIFFTDTPDKPFYLFSPLSISRFMDPLDSQYVWTNVYDYYLYQMATYLGDKKFVIGIKSEKKDETRRYGIEKWPQKPTDEFRAYQQRAMYRGNLLKFVNPYYDPSDRSFDLSKHDRNMRTILLCSTIDREIYYANTNRYWGIGVDFNDTPHDSMNPANTFTGQNKIGKILMAIRTQLFTSTRPEINTFLENDAKELARSKSSLQSSFWKGLM